MASSQLVDADTGRPGSSPCPGSPGIFLASDDDNFGLEHLDGPCVKNVPPGCALDAMFVDTTGYQVDSSGLELAFNDVDDTLDPHTDAAAVLLELEGDALEATWTARFPFVADDDLLYGIGGSEAPLAPFTQSSGPTSRPFYKTFSPAGFSDVPSRRSPDSLLYPSALEPFSSPHSPDLADHPKGECIDC
ncbi:hypothetical protein BC628DRAFT_1372411 [Trametes gibbosa]|nr:hypothetical protein BC628DRAFT_1372411 [Trametes gibbosa]